MGYEVFPRLHNPMCRTTERKKDPIPQSTSTRPASCIKGINCLTEFFSEREEGQAGPPNGLRVRKSSIGERGRVRAGRLKLPLSG